MHKNKFIFIDININSKLKRSCVHECRENYLFIQMSGKKTVEEHRGTFSKKLKLINIWYIVRTTDTPNTFKY